MARLAYSGEASADIDEIAEFSVERFGPEIALAYVDGLETACERLANFPELAAVFPRIRPEMRCLAYRSHRIFYRIEAGEVLIVRVLHSARDVKRTLG